jgi:hypothetical protein
MSDFTAHNNHVTAKTIKFIIFLTGKYSKFVIEQRKEPLSPPGREADEKRALIHLLVC